MAAWAGTVCCFVCLLRGLKMKQVPWSVSMGMELKGPPPKKKKKKKKKKKNPKLAQSSFTVYDWSSLLKYRNLKLIMFNATMSAAPFCVWKLVSVT